jgi:TonB-linked SusC/RagA family outer membrane protein
LQRKPKLLIMTVNRLLAKSTLLTSVLILAALVGIAQTRQISGKVTDSKDGSAVSNASVTLKGTKTGTTTDASGNFKLSVSGSSAVLIVSSVGFNKIEVPVGEQSVVQVSLVAASAALTEVVVVGYGTQRKKDLTGAVATVSSKDFVKGAIQTPEQLIAGKVAGVQITPNNGSPGSGSVIRIRGGASLSASNDPLIVIDGVPVDNGGVAGSANPLNLINPSDIETFTILKDPSAAAIYGSRASNGVILITTKKGKKGKLKWNFGAQAFLQTPSGKVDILSADQIRRIINEKGDADEIAALGTSNTNWQDEIYQNALAQDFNLSVSGAAIGGKWPFRLSGGYLNQDGILRTGNFKRMTGAFNLSPSFLNNKLKVDVNLKLSKTSNVFADEGAIGNAVTFDPTKPIRSTSNRYGGYWEWLDNDGLPNQLSNRNPVALLDGNLRSNSSDVLRSIGNIQLDYQLPFVKGLRVNVNYGYDFSRGRGVSLVSDSAATNYRGGGSFSPYAGERTNTVYDVYLNYVKEIKSIRSKIDLMAGHGRQKFNNYTFNPPYGRRFNGDTVPGTKQEFLNNGNPGFLLISYYGRLNYTLADKYVLTLNLRTDGSSKFYKGGRWGIFPGGALAWRVSEEAFLKNSKVISDLKLRVGYGVTGQQDGISFFGYVPSYGISNNQALYQFGDQYVNMFRPSAYFEQLSWETTTNINAAVDFGLFSNRITGTFEAFVRKTENLLSEVPVPAGANFSNRILKNVGNIESQGFEITLNATPVKTKNLEWSIGANLTYVEPKITKLLDNPDPKFKGIPVGGISGGTGNTIQRQQVGQRPNTFFVHKQVYDANNKPIEGLYEDLNRDGIINENDLYLYQNPAARYFLGFTSNLSYKRVSFGFVMRANIGNYMYNNFASNTGARNNIYNTTTKAIQNGSVDYLNTNFQNPQFFSDYYIQNASFLRMDNISFGYDVGEIAKGARLRISANIQNAFVITEYKGLDPEIFGGVDNNIYPRPRTYVLGLNLDF